MKRSHLATLLGVVVPLALVAASLYVAWAQAHQDRLNQALVAAVGREDTARVRQLLLQGADANARATISRPRSLWRNLLDLLLLKQHPVQWQGPTVLHMSASGLDARIAGLLLDHGARGGAAVLMSVLQAACDKQILRDEDNRGRMDPLQAFYCTSYVSVLLSHGVNPNARIPDGDTALGLAARGCPVPVVRLLLERGALVNARDGGGYTPLMRAAYRGYDVVDVIRLLVGHGADVNALADDGTPTLNIVSFHGGRQAAQLLRKHGAKGRDFSRRGLPRVLGVRIGVDTIGRLERRFGPGAVTTGGHAGGARTWTFRNGLSLYADGFDYARTSDGGNPEIIDDLHLENWTGRLDSTPKVPGPLFGVWAPLRRGMTQRQVLALLGAELPKPTVTSGAISATQRGEVRVDGRSYKTEWAIRLEFQRGGLDGLYLGADTDWDSDR